MIVITLWGKSYPVLAEYRASIKVWVCCVAEWREGVWVPVEGILAATGSTLDRAVHLLSLQVATWVGGG